MLPNAGLYHPKSFNIKDSQLYYILKPVKYNFNPMENTIYQEYIFYNSVNFLGKLYEEELVSIKIGLWKGWSHAHKQPRINQLSGKYFLFPKSGSCSQDLFKL